MSFIFRLGQQLISVDESSSYLERLPGYNTDYDNDGPDDDFIPNPHWNYEANMPQEVYEDILYQDAEMTRDQEPAIPLPVETKRISIDFQSLQLKKLAIPPVQIFSLLH